MSESFNRRYAKLRWRLAHPREVREYNRRWRAAHQAQARAGSAERMRRYRARRRVMAGSPALGPLPPGTAARLAATKSQRNGATTAPT